MVYIVEDIVVSEETFKVSFTVINIGNGQTDIGFWYDRVVSLFEKLHFCVKLYQHEFYFLQFGLFICFLQT